MLDELKKKQTAFLLSETYLPFGWPKGLMLGDWSYVGPFRFSLLRFPPSPTAVGFSNRDVAPL